MTTLADAAITDFDADYLTGTARSRFPITLSGTDLNVTESVIIDGSTQAGYNAAKGPIIELNATGISSGDPNGLTLTTGASTVRGLVINRAGDDGIEIDVNAGGSTIVANYLGTDVSGLQTTFGNGYGITVKSDGNTIGGTSTVDRNVIGGNSTLSSLSFGIGFWQDADNNIVQGNYIGVGADGTTGDATGYGEGQTLIGISDVTTNGSGNASFSTTFTAAVSAGRAISATVSKLDLGDSPIETSEFAQNVIATSSNSAPTDIVFESETASQQTVNSYGTSDQIDPAIAAFSDGG